MFDAMFEAMSKPFTMPVGWQGFAYGVCGRVIITYGRNFIEQYSDSAAAAGDETKQDLNESSEKE